MAAKLKPKGKQPFDRVLELLKNSLGAKNHTGFLDYSLCGQCGGLLEFPLPKI
jgi:hypothetical protein